MNVYVLTQHEPHSPHEDLGVYSTLDLAKERVAQLVRSIRFPANITWWIAAHTLDSQRGYPVRVYSFKEGWSDWL